DVSSSGPALKSVGRRIARTAQAACGLRRRDPLTTSPPNGAISDHGSESVLANHSLADLAVVCADDGGVMVNARFGRLLAVGLSVLGDSSIMGPHMSAVPLAAASSTAFPAGTPSAIPGTIRAEYFDTGGEGVAYHDT